MNNLNERFKSSAEATIPIPPTYHWGTSTTGSPAVPIYSLSTTNGTVHSHAVPVGGG